MSTVKPPQLTIYLSADDDDEASAAAIEQFKSAAVVQGMRGFSMPECTHVDVVLIEGVWRKAYEFTAELLPAVS